MSCLLFRGGHLGPDGVYHEPVAYSTELATCLTEPVVHAVGMVLLSLPPFIYTIKYFFSSLQTLLVLRLPSFFPRQDVLTKNLDPQNFSFNSTVFAVFLGAIAVCIWYRLLRSVASGFHLPKKFKDCDNLPFSLQGRIAVITGGNAGLGRKTTEQLYAWGATVLIGCRRVDEAKLLAASLEGTAYEAEQVHSSRQNPPSVSQKKWTPVVPPCTSKDASGESKGDGICKAAAVPAGKVRVCYLDLTKLATVKEFADWVLAESGGKVDLLINNAGIAGASTLVVEESTGCERTFVANHLGGFLLTNLLLPAVKRANGRVINLSSLANVYRDARLRPLDYVIREDVKSHVAAILEKPVQDLLGKPLCDANYSQHKAYGASKTMNLWFTKELQRRLTADTKTTAATYAVHPGVVHTALMLGVFKLKQTDDEDSKKIDNDERGIHKKEERAQGNKNLKKKLRYYLNSAKGFINFAFDKLCLRNITKTPEEGAATQLYLCVEESANLKPGAFYMDGKASWVDSVVLDEVRQKELWEISCVLCEKYLHANAPTTAT